MMVCVLKCFVVVYNAVLVSLSIACFLDFMYSERSKNHHTFSAWYQPVFICVHILHNFLHAGADECFADPYIPMIPHFLAAPSASVAIIGGAVAGVLAGLFLILIVVVIVICRKKQKKKYV